MSGAATVEGRPNQLRFRSVDPIGFRIVTRKLVGDHLFEPDPLVGFGQLAGGRAGVHTPGGPGGHHPPGARQGQPLFARVAVVEQHDVLPFAGFGICIPQIQEGVRDFLVEDLWVDSAEVFGACKELDLEFAQLRAGIWNDEKVEIGIECGKGDRKNENRPQQPSDWDSTGLQGHQLTVGVHSTGGQQDAEEKTHRDRQNDHVRQRDEQNLGGISYRDTAHQDLFDEVVETADDHQKGIGHEPEDGGSEDLTNCEAVNDSEEPHHRFPGRGGVTSPNPLFLPGFVTRVTRRRGQTGFLALGRGGVLFSCSTLSTPERENTSG